MFPRVFSYKNQASLKNCQRIAFPRQNDYICMIQNYKKLKNMRKALILCGFVAAFLCLAQNANAQIAGPIHRDGAFLADQRGNILSNQEVLTLVGQDIYNQTYVGAQKQRKAGKDWSAAPSSMGSVCPRLPEKSIRTAARMKSRQPSRGIPDRPAWSWEEPC